ncbi:MAG: 50S ribosomal protein L18 [Anaerolineaceae bacterium]|jgi:large subunit ribosomal protein L18|nr:50S ribosomal protein L18 [Anaerolineaceae bacterium]HNX45471.1 50S ribosomal protein L18 [Anaerolineaceae bacterium]HPT23006.1 50S ribosomal protein L18 [Anaerolineaceae bacterium]
MAKKSKNQARLRRHIRVRKKIFGTPEKPRLNVFRSITQIYAQVIDDHSGVTLVSASTIDKELREAVAGKNKSEQASLVGEALAKRALEKGIKTVVMDRGGYYYTGRLKALADGARKGGLEF